MGLVVVKSIYELKKVGVFLIIFAIAMPIFNASVAILLGYFFELSQGDTFLLVLLAGSAFYIAVPAAMRLSVPEANDLLSNNYILTMCEEEKVEKMLEKIRSFIDKYGEKCLISDSLVLLSSKASRSL